MANSNEFKNVKRENQIRRNDSINDLHVNLYDVDSVIKYYFDKVSHLHLYETSQTLFDVLKKRRKKMRKHKYKKYGKRMKANKK